MVFLRDEETARRWESEEPGQRNIFPLDQAVRFADRYFTPLTGG
jgi:hypothetical protein